MQILVTHVTRMAHGFCCVAGLSEREHRHVRPVAGQRLHTGLLAPPGPFDMGAVVELGRTHPAGARPPEVEDALFAPERARRAGYVSPSRLWSILEETAAESLYDIFGPSLEHHQNRRASVPLLAGEASLGTYLPIASCALAVRTTGDSASLRVVLASEGLDLSLTDARYYEDEFRAPAMDRVCLATKAIDDGTPVILGVGLTRPFAPADGQSERHWLQVNALHLASNPGLRLRADRLA